MGATESRWSALLERAMRATLPFEISRAYEALQPLRV